MAAEGDRLTRRDAACPVCGAAARPVFAVDGYSVADCGACGHRFSPDAVREDHLGSVYGDAYFFGGGDGYDDYLIEADLLRAQGLRYGQLLAGHATPARVLDVGSAAGFISAGLRDAGWTPTGLEPNPTMVAHARDNLELDAAQGSLEDAPAWEPFDAVCLIQVIGHFHDLARAMASVARLTRPDGLCLIEYWRRDSWIARLLGRRWHEYSPPSVLHWFTAASLDRLMAANGFACVASGAPKKYILGQHAKSLLLHKLAGLPLGSVLGAPVRLVPDALRIRYPAFDLEWRLYRRSGAASPPADPLPTS